MPARLLVTYLHPYRRGLAAVVALQTVATVAALYLPSLNADIIDLGVARGDSGYILSTGAWMLLVTLAQVAGAAGAVWFGARAAMAFGRDLRAAVFRRVGEFSAREVAWFGAPSLINRTTNDVQQVQMLVVMLCTMAVGAPITCVAGVAMALQEDVGLSWLLAVCVPLLAISVGIVVVRMVPAFRRMQERLDLVNRVLREQLSGLRVVRAFGREPVERARFADANRSLTDTALRVGKLQALIFPTVMLVLNVSSVAVLWFGAHRVDDGAMQVGALTAFLSYLAQILLAVMMATFIATAIPRAAVCAERIREVLDTEPSVGVPAEPVRDLTGPPGITFHGVGLRYPGAEEPVLRDVSFHVAPGTTTAVVGGTGAGKTTLLSLVPRLMDVTDGQVLVHGVDVRTADPAALRSRLGLVPQKAYLFSGTVATNLRYGDPAAPDDALWTALEIAQARAFVEEMGGLDAVVEQGGANLSGGQRQRLSIARALVRRPDVYLFDDAFSALDLATDAALRAALRPYTADAAVLMVAQRIATVRDADQIVVLEGGAGSSVVGIGTHDDLLESCPAYREIVQSQLTPEPAA